MAAGNLLFIAGTPTVELARSIGDPITSTAGNDQAAIVTDAIIREEYNTWKTCRFVIKPVAYDWYNTVIEPILQGSDTPLIWVRFGISSGSNDKFMRPWEQHLIRWTENQPDKLGNNGGIVIIDTVDRLYLTDRIQKTVIRRGGFSGIVNQIMEENSVSASDVVAEPSQNDSTVMSWVQSTATDFEFLTQRLGRSYISSSGAGDYRLYCRDNKIHFHTVGYVGARPVGYDASFFQLGNLTQVHLEDNFYALMLDGGAGVDAVAVDPESGQTVSVKSNSEGSAILATGERPILANATRALLVHISENKLGDVEGRAQDIYDERRSNYYAAKFILAGNTNVSLGDVINLQFKSNEPYAGSYTVTNVTTIVSASEVTAKIVARRGQLTQGIGLSASTIYEPGQAILANNGAAGRMISPQDQSGDGELPTLDPETGNQLP